MHHKLLDAQRLVDRIRHGVDLLADLRDWHEVHGSENGRLRQPLDVANKVTPASAELAVTMNCAAKEIVNEEQSIELTAAAQRCIELGQSLAAWLKQSLPGCVYWIEVRQGKRPRTELHCSPIEVGPVLKANSSTG